MIVSNSVCVKAKLETTDTETIQNCRDVLRNIADAIIHRGFDYYYSETDEMYHNVDKILTMMDDLDIIAHLSLISKENDAL